MTLAEAKKLTIPYYNYIHNYAFNTTRYIPTMDYTSCFDLIKQKHADADFNEFYDVFMLVCYNEAM